MPKNLKDDIDHPMLDLVAMFALLGCEPRWSCCGFDYPGQPYWKSHLYGHKQILFPSNPRTIELLSLVMDDDLLTQDGWHGIIRKLPHQTTTLMLTATHEREDHPWMNRDSVHYAEVPLTQIQRLEDHLLKLRSHFEDQVILTDTNATMVTAVRGWAFTPAEPWLIRKSELPYRLTPVAPPTENARC